MNVRLIAICVFCTGVLLSWINTTNAAYVRSVPIRTVMFQTRCWAQPESRCHEMNTQPSRVAHLWIVDEGRSVGFRIPYVTNQHHITYELTYTSNTIPKGIAGTHDFTDDDTDFVRSPILLGTCSSHGTCMIDPEITDIRLHADVTDTSGSHHSFDAALR